MMLSIIVLVLIMVGLFRFTGLMFHIAGRILGLLLGIFGWLILAVLAITLLGFALYAIPIILIIGIVAIAVAAAN